MERKETYPVEAIFKHVGDAIPDRRVKNEVDFDGDLIKMNSQRYHLFKHKGCACKCGVVGTFFAKERARHANPGRWHFNLYAIKEDGTEVMMTKDHIVPKSKGGPDHFDNYEPMCTECNSNKGNNF